MNASRIIIGAVVLCLFGMFGWPTPYRYETIWDEVTKEEAEITEAGQVIYRINRLTGHAERLAPPK